MERSWKQKDFEDQVEMARTRSAFHHFVGHLEMYCDNSDCSAREVDILVKEYDQKTVSCPRCCLCGEELKTHHVLTMIERGERDKRVHQIREVMSGNVTV